MADENPYAAPSTPAGTAIADSHSPPRVITGILLFIGTCFLLLLNGQHFTNRLVFLTLVAVSGSIWYRYRARAYSHDPNAGRLSLMLHLILLVAFAVTLPDAFSRQNGFNSAIERVTIERVSDQSRTPIP